MGDGEFDGGGSVTWVVRNSDGEYGRGNKTACEGKDRDPKGEGAMFRVLINGELAALTPVIGTRIQVQWGPDAEAPIKKTAARRATASRKTARKTVKKTARA